MKSFKDLLVLGLFLFILRKSSANPIESVENSDPNSYVCYDEYSCNGCGIIEVSVNGRTCQVCTCGDQFKKIKNEILPFTKPTRSPTRASRIPPRTSALTQAVPKSNPNEFLCTEEYVCNCGIVQISANGKTCQVCSCGEQFKYFTQNVKPFLKPSNVRITRTSTISNPKSYVCYDEPECSCETFKAYINGKMCTICLCGSQIEYLAKEVVPNLVVTKRRRDPTSLKTNLESAASFSCTEEYACENNCGIVQITTLKNTCQVCGCGDQYKYFMNNVYPLLKTSTKRITRPSRASRTSNQAIIDNEFNCYDDIECSFCINKDISE
ncbi:hypothetical protein BpHYR1_021521 [Brachionus plicatilis]|uniref:Uncharacterized protein n=1 Tax=Brachionus plicatilis TaxID=10195 RepID=A0A3M7SF68_BRAPC|nr:hypothetical protein BpHYR1_021521 [Brachionus plicatilis]